jgi:hypothetical protein
MTNVRSISPLLGPDVLAALLAHVDPEHPVTVVAVSALATEASGVVGPALVEQAHRCATVVPGLEEALLAHADARSLVAWAVSGQAVDPATVFRAAWSRAGDDERRQVARQLPSDIVAELSAAANVSELAALAHAPGEDVAVRLEPRLAEPAPDSADGVTFAELLLTSGASIPDAVAVTCLRLLPQRPDPEDWEAYRAWRPRVQRVARAQPYLAVRVARDPAFTGVDRFLMAALDRLDVVWDLLDSETLKDAVDHVLEKTGKQVRMASRTRTAHARRRVNAGDDETASDAEPEDEHSTAVVVAAYLLTHELAFLLPSARGAAPRIVHQWHARRSDHLVAAAAEQAAALVRAANPETLAEQTGATALAAAALTAPTLTEAAMAAVRHLIDAARRRTAATAQRYGRDEWADVERQLNARPAQDLDRCSGSRDEVLAQLARSGDRDQIVALAWRVLVRHDPYSLDDVLSCDPDPHAALVAVLTDAYAWVTKLDAARDRELRTRLVGAVLASRYVTPEAVFQLPVTVLGADAPRHRNRRDPLVETLLAGLASDRAAWSRLAAIVSPVVGREAWRPLGDLLTAITDVPTDPEDDSTARPPTVAELRATGMNEPVARSWVKTGLTLVDIREWIVAGVKPGSAVPYRELGAVSVEDARWLLAHRIRALDARQYAAASLSFADLKRLVEAGLTPEDAAGFAAAGATGTRAVEALRAANISGHTAEVFAKRGITGAKQISVWEARGVTAHTVRQFDAYSLDEIARLVNLLEHRGRLGYGTVPRMNVDLVERIIEAGIEPRWAIVLHDAGLLTATFLRRHRTKLAATRLPEQPYSWVKPTAADIHTALGLDPQVT